MKREIKFRALNSDNELIYGLPYTDGVNDTKYYKEFNNRLCWRNDEGAQCNQPYRNGTLMQYTGLKDNSSDNVCIYEGDIVSLLGIVKGNIYEMDKGETDIIIQDFGGETWCETYNEAISRGCRHT